MDQPLDAVSPSIPREGYGKATFRPYREPESGCYTGPMPLLSKENVKLLSKDDLKKHFKQLDKESEDAEASKWAPVVPKLFEKKMKHFLVECGHFVNEKVVLHIINVDPRKFRGEPQRFMDLLYRHFDMIYKPKVNFDMGMMSQDKRASSPDSFSVIWVPDVPAAFLERIRKKVYELDEVLSKL